MSNEQRLNMSNQQAIMARRCTQVVVPPICPECGKRLFHDESDLQGQVKTLTDAVKQLLDGHFPDLCYGPCEHIDCKEARKAREFAMAALSQVPAQKEQDNG